MLRSVGLWRAVLQRSRSDWPVVLAAWLLLLCATTLLATGALYADTVARGGVRRALLEAPAGDRVILARTTVPRAAEVESRDEPVRAALADSIRETGGEVATVLRSGSFADAAVDPDAVNLLTVLAAYQGIERHAQLTGGVWPQPGATPVEAALPESAAAALGLDIGDTIELASRRDAGVLVTVEVTALWRADPDDPYWAGERLEIEGVVPGDPYTTAGPVVVPRDDLLGDAFGGRLEVEWRAVPDIGALAVDDVAALRRDLELVDERISDAIPGRQVTSSAPLAPRLAEVDRTALVARSGVTLLTVQFAVLAAYAVVLVGGLLLERRRSEVALLRSRGATSGHLLVMALAEGLVLAATAVALAPILALAIVQALARSGPLAGSGTVATEETLGGAWAIAAIAGLAGVLALSLPTAGSSVNLSGVRAAIGRQTGRTLPQRLGLDLALVVLAVVAIWQLRLYGAPLTRNARGVLGIDPLLVAAPAIGLLGGAVLAMRVVPRLAEIGERVLVRRRDLVAPLGGRQLARRPLRYTRAALLLMLAAGLGTFASAHAATWTRSQGDQAAYESAADIRVVPGEQRALPSLVEASALRSVPGVEEAMPVARRTIDLGRNVRGGPLLAVDPAAAARIVPLVSDGGAASGTDALAALAARPRPEGPLALPGTPARLSILVDADLQMERFQEPLDDPVPDEHLGVTPHAVVTDADGVLHRATGAPGSLAGEGQRLEIPLLPPERAGLAPRFPLALVAVELVLSTPSGIMATGSVDLREVAVSDAPAGDRWTRVNVDPGARPWRWIRSIATRGEDYRSEDGPPERVTASQSTPVFSGQPLTFRLLALPADPPAVGVIASRRFLEATGVRVGETVTATSIGQRLPLEVVATVPEFPPLDPGQPFVVIDRATIDLARFAETGQTPPVDEWWLDVEDGSEAAVADTVRGGPLAASLVVDRVALGRSLATDPVSLGIIGALGLGAVAALVFAAIGFVVSATVSTSERLREFALLQALGLSGRQLVVWLSLESAFLLGVGVIAGVALGLLLAWLVLPFATLTAAGAAAVPAPVIVVPWSAILPAAALTAVLLGVTMLIVRRQLPSVSLSSVLRARDE